MDEKAYLFHQTPEDLCKKLLTYIPFVEGQVVLEPFKGEGNFYRNLPTNTINHWCELQQSVCYTSYTDQPDWVISNPPFKLQQGEKRVNAFYFLLEYWCNRATTGVAFLANYNCWNSLTPRRLEILSKTGFYLTKVVVCNVKKWSGRYYFLIFTKEKNTFLNHIVGSF